MRTTFVIPNYISLIKIQDKPLILSMCGQIKVLRNYYTRLQ